MTAPKLTRHQRRALCRFLDVRGGLTDLGVQFIVNCQPKTLLALIDLGYVASSGRTIYRATQAGVDAIEGRE